MEFEIIKQEAFTAEHFGNERFLTTLGGCIDTTDDSDYGLGDWQYSFVVKATNQSGETQTFDVAYQPAERNNSIEAYNGYEVATASKFGCDADESAELEAFCDYDTAVLNALHKIAKAAAKAEHERLLGLLKAGDIKPNQD